MTAPDRPDWSLPVEQPVGLSWAYTELVTSSTPAVWTPSTIVPAPGPGLRLRIWGVSMAGEANNTAPVVVGVGPHSTGQLLVFAGGVGTPSAGTGLPPGGLAIYENDAIDVWFASPAANQGLRVAVWYTTEVV
ncbi:MAG TPA: hypothetical protein VNJ28_04665 [Candidatus Limnocylindrales bacterium]|nr:hypothetical protein [Candidatus Limnocylindrales bacterium]